MFVCFHVLLGGLFWCGWLLWLVISAVVYRCNLMCKLIRLHTRACVGGEIRLVDCVYIACPFFFTFIRKTYLCRFENEVESTGNLKYILSLNLLNPNGSQ